MATLTISISGSAVVNGARNYTLSDAMVTRLINAMRAPYMPGDTRTDAQVLAAWADMLIERTKQHVLVEEQSAAKRGVGQIEIT
jgi:hypothetical protein